MRIEEAVECMSKSYLHRILDSYMKDTIKPDEDTSRKRVIKDHDLFVQVLRLLQRGDEEREGQRALVPFAQCILEAGRVIATDRQRDLRLQDNEAEIGVGFVRACVGLACQIRDSEIRSKGQKQLIDPFLVRVEYGLGVVLKLLLLCGLLG